ncbi:MAG: DUF29 domain-containing protein [Acidobacteria bacterium]|jgi:hypothetical protein|nr:MAG: DUF29 domain-containing protein [Acidobacteriota bacterium]
MSAISKEELKELYDKDFPLWAEINLELLKEKAYELVDWENLLEEIEDISRSDLKACIGYLAVILEHLYKWDNFRSLTTGGEEKGGRSWIISVVNAKGELEILLEEYPSLRLKVPEEMQKAWKRARVKLRSWLVENGYSPKSFSIPEECPYTYEEAMTRELDKELGAP